MVLLLGLFLKGQLMRILCLFLIYTFILVPGMEMRWLHP